MRKESEFRQHSCRNSNKKHERGKKNDVMGGGRKNLNFSNEITEILVAQNSCPSEVIGEVPELLGEVPQREKTNFGNQVAKMVGEWGERK